MDYNSFSLKRRLLVRSLVAAGIVIPLEIRSVGAQLGLSKAEDVRDYAIRTLRRTDLSPPWFTSANWDNRAYGAWTDYLVGKLSEAEFTVLCAQPSDYCLQNVWNLRKGTLGSIDWRNAMPLNWSGIHALALRYFRTGDSMYLRKWLAFVRDFAVHRPQQLHDQAQVALKKGAPGALLDAAMAWGGIFTAFAILAKGAGQMPNARDRIDGSPFAPRIDKPSASALAEFPVQVVFEIANAFASGDAPYLAHYYSQARYIPNQRIYGLEALAYLVAFFPGLPEASARGAQLDAALRDCFERYQHADGGQLEQSFGYAEAIAFAAERLSKLPFATTPPWKGGAKKLIDGWYRMAAALATPQGGLPQVGNTVWGRQGKYRDPPRFTMTSIAFPYSGYYVQRSSWAKDAGYLFFFYRRAARGHSMAGCNSIQLGAYGRQLLVAGGSANYRGTSRDFPNSPGYLSEASSYKTNTIVVDKRFQKGGSLQGILREKTGKPNILSVPTLPIQSRWHTSQHFDYVEGVFDRGYRGSLYGDRHGLVSEVTHWRQVVFVRSLMLWIVVDVMLTRGSHEYTQIWKFAAPKNGLAIPGFTKEQVVLGPAERTIRTIDSALDAVNISLLHFGETGLDYRSYFGEGHFGYVGPGALSEPVPATDVHIVWNGDGNQILVTLLEPYRGMRSRIAIADDSSGHARAGFRLETDDGSRLSCVAGALPATLVLGKHFVPSGTLILALEKHGEPERGVVVTPMESYEFGRETRIPINIPKTFRWVSDTTGRLVPTYTEST